MTEEGSTTPEITDEQFKSWIGEVVDEKNKSLFDGITNLFKEHNSGSSFDEEGFLSKLADTIKSNSTSNNVNEETLLSKVGEMLDGKLAGISSGNVQQRSKRVGPIGRWLTGGSN